MQSQLTGNTKGLKASQIRALERIYRRRVPPSQIVTYELATYMAQLSRELNRQIGVLINRRGAIEHVAVGDAARLWLPDVGRLRGAPGRFRGLRLVHTHLRDESLTRDDLTDLALLRLDLVAAVTATEEGLAGTVHVGHLLPDNPAGEIWAELEPEPAHALSVDFAELMSSLEAEFARSAKLLAAEIPGETRALLAHVAIGRELDTEARIAELKELCRTAEVEVLDLVVQRRQHMDPKYLVGKGKLEHILLRAMQVGAETVIFNCDLSPGQARAISDFTELKILDRTMLILDIFARHARSSGGKRQVELAQLKYVLPRLVAKNTMMSRLAGGIGGRGPGETKLEVNRRRARERIVLLEKKLGELARTRRLRRQRRNRREVPVVAIIGYTNAGKSTLLNLLTEGDAVAENKLFATLDPISRRLRFPREREVVLTDTVGFIRDLPDDLRTAFRATLEELEDADLLLHVVDISDADHDQHIEAVTGILRELELADKSRLVVANKIDRLPPAEGEHLARSLGGFAISALDRSSLGPLLSAMELELWEGGALHRAPETRAAAPLAT
jgi:GTP-binding protein HflX